LYANYRKLSSGVLYRKKKKYKNKRLLDLAELKKRHLSWLLNVEMSLSRRSSAGSEFQAVEPVTENARSPNFIRVLGTVYS
jgi:hypothetical protein